MSILIADDDPLNVKLISFLLQEAGYQIVKITNPLDIIPSITKHEPDLILLDVNMPKIDGFDVCRQVRRISDVPIVFLSGRAQLEDRVTGLQIGADDYIIKPFEPAELLARIEAVLRRRDNDILHTSSRLTQGNITLDPLQHKAMYSDGRSKVLTPIEFRLMYYLMKNAGRALSTDQILDKVWSYNSETGSNLVAVYIRRLRNKIEDVVENPRYIVTVPYVGYKFEAQGLSSEKKEKQAVPIK